MSGAKAILPLWKQREERAAEPSTLTCTAAYDAAALDESSS